MSFLFHFCTGMKNWILDCDTLQEGAVEVLDTAWKQGDCRPSWISARDDPVSEIGIKLVEERIYICAHIKIFLDNELDELNITKF